MTGDFAINDDFDKYAWETGRWSYDNGWNYKGEFFGASYVQNEIKKNAEGELDYFQLLRNGITHNRTILIHVHRTQQIEIWSGQVESKIDFDKMMEILKKYKGHGV
jgi:hypothetical protein